MNEKVRKIILLICICVFCYSTFQLGSIFYEYYQIQKQSEELIANVVEKVPPKVDEDPNSPLNRKINFDELFKINKDVIGWIYIPDTNIDEPILKGKDNDTYLRHNIENKYMIAGAIFIDENNEKDFQDKNTIIYGHNMKNGSRFNNVKKFVNKDFFDEHPFVYIYLPDGSIHIYSIYVSRVLNAYSDLYVKDINYNQYVQTIQKGAKQKREAPDQERPLILMSTCVKSKDDNRYILSAWLDKIIKQ